MSNIEKISSKDALGLKIGCVTLTKPFFKKAGIADNNSKNLPFSLSTYKGLPVQYMNQVHGTSGVKNARCVSSATVDVNGSRARVCRWAACIHR